MRKVISSFIFIIGLTTFSYAQWFQQTSGTTEWLEDIHFIDASYGTAVGSYEDGIILRTTNGGTTWTQQTNGVPTFTWLFAVYFTDVNTGTAVGDGGTGVILKTTNGGNNWISQSSGTSLPLNDVFYIDSNNGTIVGGGASTSVILKTTNGGTNWTIQNFAGYRLISVFFADANNGITVGTNGTILKTTNGGTSWTPQVSGVTTILVDVCFTDVNIGWIVGNFGTILKTTNGGASWVSQTAGTNDNLIGVHCTDANNVTIVGANGKILRTTDGGTTWSSQPSGITTSLHSVHFTDMNTGWIAGANGKILHTSNGGGIPVELVSFNAAAINNAVHLNWVTATETNNKGFEVHKHKVQSIKAKVNEGWQLLTFIRGSGTTTETQAYSYIDDNVQPGKYLYRLKQIDFDGSFEYSKEVEAEIISPEEFVLYQNYPNPFNPSTNLRFRIPARPAGESNFGFVSLKVYDVLGNEITTLVNEVKEPGEYEIEFDAKGLSSGVYFYRLQSGSFTGIKKFVLLK